MIPASVTSATTSTRGNRDGNGSLIAAIPMSVVLIGISTGVGTEKSGTTPTISVGTVTLCGLSSDTPAESKSQLCKDATTPLALPVCTAQASPADVPRFPNESRAASFLSQPRSRSRRNQAPFRLCRRHRVSIWTVRFRHALPLPPTHADGSQSPSEDRLRGLLLTLNLPTGVRVRNGHFAFHSSAICDAQEAKSPRRPSQVVGSDYFFALRDIASAAFADGVDLVVVHQLAERLPQLPPVRHASHRWLPARPRQSDPRCPSGSGRPRFPITLTIALQRVLLCFRNPRALRLFRRGLRCFSLRPTDDQRCKIDRRHFQHC